jgi:hypothetical protein
MTALPPGAGPAGGPFPLPGITGSPGGRVKNALRAPLRGQCRVVKRSALAVNLFGLHSGFRPWAAAVNAAELL